MSKPIKLTDELKKSAIEEFIRSISSMKMADGKINYNKNFTYKDDDKAVVYFTATAYAKMLKLLMAFTSEVAWHGVGRRIEGANFLISDILVYPQTVSGTTVEMDTEEYAKWLMENIEDERFNNIVMQGHSHVNMGCTPSAVDTTHQEQILGQLSDDMFYIFMIWNKKLDNNIKIYDLANNTLYEDKDISYAIYDEETDLDAFLEEAESQVKKRTYTTPAYQGYGSQYYGNSQYAQQQNKQSNAASQTSAKSKSKQKGKSDVGNGWNGRGTYDMDEEAYGYGRYAGYYD